MIKGVNKNVIEIIETDNAYFERAILFVRTSFEKKEPSQIKDAAKSYLSTLKTRKHGYTRFRWGLALVKLGSAAAVGAVVATAVLRG